MFDYETEIYGQIAIDPDVQAAQRDYLVAACASDDPIFFPLTEEGLALIVTISKMRLRAAVRIRRQTTEG